MNKQLALFSILLFSAINMTAMEKPSTLPAEPAKIIVKRGRLMPWLVGVAMGSAATAWALETHREEIYAHRNRTQQFFHLFYETMQQSREGACRPWQNWWATQQLPQPEQKPETTTNSTSQSNTQE